MGVRPIFGGYHKTFGTKNALINLTNETYLELLAADASNLEVQTPRWMGIDLLTKNQITRWALKSNTLQSDSAVLKKYNSAMNAIQNGSRNSADDSVLQWELLMPLATPEVEIVPFMVDWSKTEKHPSQLLPDMNCELKEIYALHPRPEIFVELFDKINFKLRIEKGNVSELKVILKTPNGTVKI